MSVFWRDKRVLVTGATGVVGSWVVKELLAQSAHVVAFIQDADPRSELIRSGDIGRVSVVNGALEDYSSVERSINLHDTDTVIHLGAQTLVQVAQRNPLHTFEANIRGTYHVLEACRRHSALVRRIVIASSDKAYGESANLPYVEDMPLHGKQPYEVSKSCADMLALSFHHSYGLPVAITRCGNVYGGGDLNWSRIVPGTIRSLLRGEVPVLRSDGTFLRDYLYVKDVVGAYLTLAEALDRESIRGQAFNFAPAAPMTVLEMVDLLRKLLGREDLSPQILNNAEGEIRDQYLSAEKARRLLGWECRFPAAAGLAETVAWYRDCIAAELVQWSDKS